MKIEDDGATLRVSHLSELSAINAAQFREQVQAAKLRRNPGATLHKYVQAISSGVGRICPD